MVQFVIVLLIGSFAGVLTGLLGSSGVMAVVPGMILLGYPAQQAIGTSLAVDMVASTVVAGTYYHHRRVDLRQGLWIALSAMLGAQVGSRLSSHVPEIGLSGGFGAVLLLMAFFFWRGESRRGLGVLRNTRLAQKLKKHSLLASLLIGMYAGIYCGIFGAGGGSLFLIALLLLGSSLHQAVGTSTMIMALTTASGTVGHALNGNLPFLTIVGLSGGTVLGSFSSARLANRMDERFLEKVVAAVFGLLGLVILVSPLFK